MSLFIQIIGYFGMFASIYSFQKNNHKQIITLQIISNFCFSIQYLLLNAVLGSLLNIAALIRSIVFFNHGKKWADSKLWLYGFCVVFIALGVATYHIPVAIDPIIKIPFILNNKNTVQTVLPALPVISMVLNTFAFGATKPSFTRKAMLVCSPLFLVYAFISGSWGATINEMFVIVSTIVGIFRYDIKKGDIKAKNFNN